MFSQEAYHSPDRKQIQTKTRQGMIPNAVSAVSFVLSMKVVVSCERKYALTHFIVRLRGGERTHHVIAPIKLCTCSIDLYDNKCKNLLKVSG